MWDFQSHAERRIALRPPITARRLRMHEGVSAYDSLDAAFDRLLRIRPEHRGIAVLILDNMANVRIEQTTSDLAHFTVWATVEVLAQSVHWVLAVEQLRQ